MGVYLYYDVKGIQSFIFKIPRLQFIIGGSALVDEFDRQTVKSFEDGKTIQLLFSGGGRGAFYCESVAHAGFLKEKIVNAAEDIGLDVRLGSDENFLQAFYHTDEVYSFLPPETMPENAVPCPLSGLYPVPADASGKSLADCHTIVEKRCFKSGERVFRRFEIDLLKGLSDFAHHDNRLEFFHNISQGEPDGDEGFKCLGERNRWAVICMDGNDMGKQFRALLNSKLNSEKNSRASDEKMLSKLSEMSRTLEQITRQAVLEGVQCVVRQWGHFHGKEAVSRPGKITLPIRPLLVGGDDVLALCRCDYAATFVKKVAAVFTEESRKHKDLWPATDNGLTISAGILFASVTLPLHTAIPYAEKLLKNAKEKGRRLAVEGSAPPACIDWEAITDSLIDTPAAKRCRELIFWDGEIKKKVILTKRPYTLEEFCQLENKAAKFGGKDKTMSLPRTIRHQIFSALRQGREDRMAFAARIKKHQPFLFDALNEYQPSKNSLWTDTETDKSTDLLDALMLLEEDKRMDLEAAS